MKRNMFIVSVEGSKEAPTAEGIKLIFNKHWGYYSGVKFKVEEGGHREVAKLVSDYLDAEDALEKFTDENHVTVGQSLNSSTGEKWMKLYDKVREKRTILVSKLREYGAMV